MSTQLDLQLDLSSCYDEMLEYLRATGCFNAIRGLTREGFSLELLNEHGKRDTFEGKDIISWAEYELDPLIGSDSNWGHHCFEDDEEWKEYHEEYVRIEKQANVLGVKLIFNNQEGLEQRLQKRLDAVYNSMLEILQNDPMGYIYENFDESGFTLLSTTCGYLDDDHYLNCDLDGGEIVEFYPEWDELYKEYQQITLEAEQLNACLVFGK